MWAFEQTPDRFIVEEQLIYEPCGSGEHIFLQIRKRGLSTHMVKRRISEMTGVPLKLISHAGLKDTRATATQWLSWPEEAQRDDVRAFEDLEILAQMRHSTRLGLGHVASNSFRLIIEGEGQFPEASVLEAPFPNFYGRQRFGREGCGDLSKMYDQTRKSREAVSVFQSRLFNAYLRQCLTKDELGKRPDEYWTHTNGKRCFQAPRDPELDARIAAGEVVPTAPMFGYKVKLRDDERAFLQNLGLGSESFRRFGKIALGARRSAWVKPQKVKATPRDKGMELSFALPSGAYATMYLIHVFLPEILAENEDSWPNFTENISLK